MVAGEDSPGQVVEPPGRGPAEIAAPGRLGLVVALPRHLAGVAVGATDPPRPPQVADDLEAARLIDQGWKVGHPWSEPNLADGADRTRWGNADTIHFYGYTEPSPADSLKRRKSDEISHFRRRPLGPVSPIVRKAGRSATSHDG